MLSLRIDYNLFPVKIAVVPPVFNQHHIRLLLQHIPFEIAEALEQRIAESGRVAQRPLQLALQQGDVIIL
ncbi:hypothetical protein D3C75_1157950 [compost metagenome]